VVERGGEAAGEEGERRGGDRWRRKRFGCWRTKTYFDRLKAYSTDTDQSDCNIICRDCWAGLVLSLYSSFLLGQLRPVFVIT
jgi:hypothetical protein